MNQIKIGCCGFARGKKEYWQQFKLVEIQQTFYKLPLLTTARKWRQEFPEDFEFTLKAWQAITHLPSSPTYRRAELSVLAGKEGNYGFFKPTQEVREAWQRTRDVAQALRAKVVVFQCPATFTPDAQNVQNMRYFFTNIDRANFVFVWEPRGKWSEDIIRSLCEDLDLVYCFDPLDSEGAYAADIRQEMNYFRLHGGRRYRHRFSDAELGRLRELISGETYVLFNNITMYEDALRFKELVERCG